MDAVPGRSCDSEIRFTRKEIFLMVKVHLKSSLSDIIEHLENVLTEKIGYSLRITDTEMRSALSTLFCQMRRKWQEGQRTEDRFFKKFEEWLKGSVAFRIPGVIPTTPSHKGGRPSSTFTSSSERTKRRKTEELRANFSSEELCYATHMSLRAEGNLHASEIIKDVSSASPSRAQNYRESIETVTERRLSDEAALAALIDNKLSARVYKRLRNLSTENNCNLYPPYRSVLRAKNKCYPSAITITESCAEVKVQSLLDHTVERILIIQQDAIKRRTPAEVRHMDLLCKWGCDGSSSQSIYKQKFSDQTKTDSDIFLTSLVPLQLSSAETSVMWSNPKPSSPRYCRPIKIQFLHETSETSLSEVEYIEKQIERLVPFNTIVDGKEITITYKLSLTMIDGKICNAISSTLSTQRCYLCGATAKEFNDIMKMLQRSKNINDAHLRFGLSNLHAWIRFFECCLHLSYKLQVQKWQVRSTEEKRLVQERKGIIQKSFQAQLGLIVDRPKPGFGNTNDGNTARRFFENHKISALITGVDERLIIRFYAILQAISSGHEINLFEFKNYAVQTAKLFVSLYSWYYMPTTVHKILIHGSQIISSALLPIGQMSEEAQEHTNKYIKKYRQDFSRKCSREKTMKDVFLRLLVSSDPYVSYLGKHQEKKIKKLTPDALKLVFLARNTQQNEDTEDDDNYYSSSDSS